MPRGRPKKAKVKEDVKEEAKISIPEVVTPTEPIKKGIICSACYHSKDMHYGSKDNWCNNNGCQCQAWKE